MQLWMELCHKSIIRLKELKPQTSFNPMQLFQSDDGFNSILKLLSRTAGEVYPVTWEPGRPETAKNKEKTIQNDQKLPKTSRNRQKCSNRPKTSENVRKIFRSHRRSRQSVPPQPPPPHRPPKPPHRPTKPPRARRRFSRPPRFFLTLE